MRKIRLGTTDLDVSVLSYGCMRISGTWNPAEIDDAKRETGIAAVLAAHEAGYTLFDHADIYCAGGGESIFGEAMRRSAELRRDAVIATKCGIRWAGDPLPDSPHRYDFSKEWILSSCEASLARLGVETIDLYQLHRPDVLMDPDEIAEAFTELRTSGKVRHFGVSNFSPSQVDALQSRLSMRLEVNQVEIHLGRLDPFTDGTLDQCLELRMTPLSWSPLGGGWLGETPDTRPDRAELLRELSSQADAAGLNPADIALAWLLRHPSGIVPIVGSVRPERIRSMARAADHAMSRDAWYRLLLAARGKPLP